MKRLIAGATTTLLLISGCNSGVKEGGGSAQISVYAAASLTEVLPRIDPSASYQFAGSDELALQIREGAPGDVFAAASPRYPLELHEDGLVDSPVVFATNELVLIVPVDNPAGIASVADLEKDDVKLVIAAEGVPVGDYTRQALENLDALSVFDNVVSEEQDVKGVVGKVALGEADAGFVYATDVGSVAGKVTTIVLPADAQPTVEYMIAVVSESDHKQQAGDFVQTLLGERGRRLLEEAGFGLP